MAGDLDRAEPLVSRSAATLRKGTESPRVLFGLAAMESTLLASLGEHDKARAFYDERLRLSTILDLENDPRVLSMNYFFALFNELMAGDLVRARAALDDAPQFGKDSWGFDYDPILVQERARLKLMEGDVSEAAQLIDHVEVQDDLLGQARSQSALRAEIYCENGRSGEGWVLIRRDIAAESACAVPQDLSAGSTSGHRWSLCPQPSRPQDGNRDGQRVKTCVRDPASR